MSNFDNQRQQREERRKTRKDNAEIMGKYFLDLSKVMVSAVTISAFSPLFTDYNATVNLWVGAFGLASSIFLAILGYSILKNR